MSRKSAGILIACMLILCIGQTAHAQTSYGSTDWQVTFTDESKMESNFEQKNIDDVIYGMQPGDNAIVTLSLANKNSSTTDWYMTNKVLKSLEDSASAASGGAYTYILTYTKPGGEKKTLFSSDTVGGNTIGEAGEGLHAATNALEDYFYLDTLSSGQRGTVTLEVALDGETQGDGYQDTLADLQMNFAVELSSSSLNPPRTNRPGTPVKTGDDTNLMPYFAVCAVSGLVLFALACYSVQQRRKEESKEA